MFLLCHSRITPKLLWYYTTTLIIIILGLGVFTPYYSRCLKVLWVLVGLDAVMLYRPGWFWGYRLMTHCIISYCEDTKLTFPQLHPGIWQLLLW